MSQQLNRTQRLGLPLATPGAIMNPFEYFNGAMERIEEIITNRMYPIGAIYCNATNGDNPNTILGFGVWEKYADGRVLVGDGTSDQNFAASLTNAASSRGGASTHRLTETQMPSHRHEVHHSYSGATQHTGNRRWLNADTISTHGYHTTFYMSNAGGGASHNNLQPYQVIYMWRRTA